MPNVWQCFIFVEYQKTQNPNSLKWALKNVPEKMPRQKIRISWIFALLLALFSMFCAELLKTYFEPILLNLESA
jgi:hypothetical protein